MGRSHLAALLTTTTVVGCIVLAGCSSPGGHRYGGYHPMALHDSIQYQDSDHTLHIWSCSAKFRMTESASRVTIVTEGWNFPPGAASCGEFDYTLSLHAPLGDRRVVDGTTGKELRVDDRGPRSPPAPALAASAPT